MHRYNNHSQSINQKLPLSLKRHSTVDRSNNSICTCTLEICAIPIDAQLTKICSFDLPVKYFAETQEFCHMETFQPRCGHGDVIVMRSALFGRMRVGRCVPADDYQSQQQFNPNFLGCSVDVLDHLHHWCSGKPSCDVSVANPELYNLKPCSAHLAMYLEASYSCISG
jgi:Galactose binding lectin domain